MSGDVARAERVASRIDAGSVALNFEARFAPSDPFGGYKCSGLDRKRGIAGLREFCQIKVVQACNETVTDA
jgi:acyl-CoA reductase-like NAD-dependent aldehyde dehydrogenase